MSFLLRISISSKLSKKSTFLLYSSLRKLYSDTDKELRKTLSNVLGIPQAKVTDILKKYKSLNRVDPSIVLINQAKLSSFGIEQDELNKYPQVLSLNTSHIENRFFLLQELGFTSISVELLMRFLNIVKKRVSLIKSYGTIPSNVKIAESIYSFLEKPPPNTASLPDLPDKNTLLEHYTTVRAHYLEIFKFGACTPSNRNFKEDERILQAGHLINCETKNETAEDLTFSRNSVFHFWRLEFSDEESFNHVIRTYTRLKHKSFRLIKEIIHLLETELFFTKERIRSHAFLLQGNPSNIRQILNDIESIGGVPIKSVLYKYPKIMMTNVDSIKNIQIVLKENDVSDEAIQKCFNVFTLSAKSIANRFNENKKIPELSALSYSSRILKLINHHRKAKYRLQYLHQQKMRNASLNLLSGTDARFERYLNEGIDRTRGDDVVQYLHRKLNVSTEIIRCELSKHPFWFHIPIIQVADTYEYLRKQYKNEDLVQALQIVLYPIEKITAVVGNVRKDFERKWLSPVQEINLCLYYIEKSHHFSGDGIWSVDHEKEPASL